MFVGEQQLPYCMTTRSHTVVLTLNHGYKAVRGHGTGSNNSGPDYDLRRKTDKTADKIALKLYS